MEECAGENFPGTLIQGDVMLYRLDQDTYTTHIVRIYSLLQEKLGTGFQPHLCRLAGVVIFWKLNQHASL